MNNYTAETKRKEREEKIFRVLSFFIAQMVQSPPITTASLRICLCMQNCGWARRKRERERERERERVCKITAILFYSFFAKYLTMIT